MTTTRSKPQRKYLKKSVVDAARPYTDGKRDLLIWDGGTARSVSGFALKVRPSGHKTFILQYRFKGSVWRYNIGTYGGGLTVQQARAEAERLKEKIRTGVNPQEEKVAERRKSSGEDTFGFLANLYLERYAKPRKRPASYEEDRRQIESQDFKDWINRPAEKITKKDVIRLLDRIVDRGSAVQANRTRALLTKIFNFGIERELVETNPALAASKPTKEKPRERVLDDNEIKKLWSGLDDLDPIVAASFKLKLLTAQRDSEIRHMRESDLDGDVWTISAIETKNGREHRVPLSPQAMKVIEECRVVIERESKAFDDKEVLIRATSGLPNKARELDRIARATKRAEQIREEKWVLPTRSSRSKKLHLRKTHQAAERLRKVAGLKPFTGHDLRRTAATGMAKLRVEPHVIGKVLNHSEQSITDKVYLWHSYDDEKRRALEKWGRYVEGLVSGKRATAKVVTLRR